MTEYALALCTQPVLTDDQSKKHHETGLKHIGNRERYIRDLYKTGNKAKLDRAEEAAELAKIEAAALKSGDTATKLTLLESLRAKQAALRAGGHKARERRPEDKFANYTSAADLGIRDEDTAKSEYEIEQELKGRAGEVGGWETVDYEPTGAYTEQEDRGEGSSTGEKRKLGQYEMQDEDDHENFDFIRRSEPETLASASAAAAPAKRKPKLDPYDEDDWDPRAAIKGKVKSAPGAGPVERHVAATNLDREGWTGKLDLKSEAAGPGMVYKSGGGWVKAEGAADGPTPVSLPMQEIEPEVEQKPDVEDLKPTVDGEMAAPPESAVAKEPSAGGLFKKRRPPPSSRKK